MKKISVLSGGLDSTILTYKLVNDFGVDKVISLSFQYGQRHNIEIEKAKITCEKLKINHQIIDISFLGEIIKEVSALSKTGNVRTPKIKEILGHPQPPTYVPYRNLILTSLALSFAESNKADEVYLGLQTHDEYSYWDTTEYFTEALNNISNLNRMNQIQIKTPFIRMSKAEEIKIGLDLKVPFQDTHTCYNPNEKGESCGDCPSCSERIMNFAKAGIIDPVPYQVNLKWDEIIKKYKEN